MRSANDLLLLGNPLLYQRSIDIMPEELPLIATWVRDLHEVMEDIRRKYSFGRGIAAPQLGIMKRLIYINIDSPKVFINPEIVDYSPGMFEVWDDCMCFPNLLVRVLRHNNIRVRYLDETWQQKEESFEGDLSELFQHEYDHLEGILCTMRAIDSRAFRWRE